MRWIIRERRKKKREERHDGIRGIVVDLRISAGGGGRGRGDNFLFFFFNS